MADFNTLIKNIYASNNIKLTPEIYNYAQQTYKDKPEEFVKNFYTSIGKKLTPDTFSYIKSTYLSQPTVPKLNASSSQLDYSKGLLGASQKFQDKFSSQFGLESRRPPGYTYNPADTELLEKGINPFNLSVSDPVYQTADSTAKAKHKNLSTISNNSFNEMIIKERDATNFYFSESQKTAENRFISTFDAKYPSDKFDLKDPTKFVGTVGLSGQTPTVVARTPQDIMQQRQDEVKTLKAQKNQVLQGMADYYSEEAAKRYTILNPEVAKNPNLKTPEGSKKHAYMVGVRSLYPLEPEKWKEYESAYDMDINALSQRGVRITGVDPAGKVVSPTELGQMVARGNKIENSITTAKVKSIDTNLKDLQGIKQDFDTELAKADSLIVQYPQAKKDEAFMKAYNENRQKYQTLLGQMASLETEKNNVLSVQEVQNTMVKNVAAPYQKLQENTEKFKKERELISDPTNPAFWGIHRVVSDLGLLKQRGIQGLYDFGSLLGSFASYMSGAEQEDLKRYAFASKSYDMQMRSELNLPTKEAFEEETRFAYTDPITDELKYNWNAIPYFAINTYLESQFMGRGGTLVGGTGSSLLARTGQFAGMALTAEILFGNQMLMSELEKGTNFKTAFGIHLFRTGLEALSEMINPLEIRLASGVERQLLNLSIDEAESLLLRSRHIKDYLANTFKTRKWDKAVEWLYKTGNYVRRGGWEATDNAFKEYLEEFMANVGNFAADKYIAANIDPNYRQENEMSIQNEWLTFTNTVAGMPLMLGQAAYQKHKQSIMSAEYQISSNPDVFLNRLEEDYAANKINDKDYQLQKGKIEYLKELGALAASDYERIDNTLLHDSIKDNTKLLLYNHTKELYEKSKEFQARVTSGETGKSIDALSEEIINYQNQREALLTDAEKYVPFDIKSPKDSLVERRRVDRAIAFQTNLYSNYRISKVSNPQELLMLAELAKELIDKEKTRENPNKSLIQRYESSIKTVEDRLEFLEVQEVNPIVSPTAPATATSSVPTPEDLTEIIARKFVESQKGNTQTLTPEEEEFLADNREVILLKANELAKDEVPEVITDIKLGPSIVSIGGQPVEGRITKVYSDESFDFEFDTEDGRTAYYPRLTKADLYQTEPEETLFGKYRVTPAGPTFEVVDIITGDIVGMGDTFQEAATSARELQMQDEKVIQDFQEEQDALARKKQQAVNLQEALQDSDSQLTEENKKSSALPRVGVVDSIEYVGKRLVDAFVSMANRMRDFAIKKTVDYYYKEAISDELDPKYSFLQSFDKYQPGTPVKFVVEENVSYLEESKAQFQSLLDSLDKNSYVNPKDLENNDYHSPIRIEDMDGNLLGYVHALAYIQEENVAPSLIEDSDDQDNLVKNYQALKDLRTSILQAYRDNPEKELQTTIVAKSAGTLSIAMKNEEGDNNYLPIQDRFNNKEVLGSLQVATAENITKEGQIVQNNIASGRPILILPMPNGKYMAAGMRRSKLTEEVAKSIIYAIQLYRGRSRRTQEIEAIAKDYNYDLATIEGLHAYMSALVYVGSNRRAFVDPATRTDANLVRVPFIDFDRGDATIWFSIERAFRKDDPEDPFKLQETEDTRDLRLNSNGIFRIALDAAFDPSLAFKQLERVIQAMNINVDKAKLEAPEYESESVNIPILEMRGDVIGVKPNPEFLNTGKDYKDFLTKHLSTNILEHEITLPDGSTEYVYFEQSTIVVDPNFITPSEKTEEEEEVVEIIPTEEAEEEITDLSTWKTGDTFTINVTGRRASTYTTEVVNIDYDGISYSITYKDASGNLKTIDNIDDSGNFEETFDTDNGILRFVSLATQAPVSDKKADIEIGKVGNTEYEVKSDGVYYQDKKLDNPKNKTNRQLIEADIERRREEELDEVEVKYSEDNIDPKTGKRALTLIEQDINAKYDAELEALKGKPKEEVKVENVKPVYHHTTVAPENFNFGTFQRGKEQISQFGDGLNASSNTTSFLTKRYGKPIEGEVNDTDFVAIDANKTEKELYDELVAKGYKFNNPATGSYIGGSAVTEYDGNEKANEQPAIISLFNDFQKSNPGVKGVKVINHIIGNQKVAPFYVIYDSKSFYGKGSLTAKIKNEKTVGEEEVKPTEEVQPTELKVGDKVKVNTPKDGEGVIKEDRGDKVLLEDGRQVYKKNLTLLQEEVKKESEDLRNSDNLTNLANDLNFDDLGLSLPKVNRYSNPSVSEADINNLKNRCN
jgi:hypothetical protein